MSDYYDAHDEHDYLYSREQLIELLRAKNILFSGLQSTIDSQADQIKALKEDAEYWYTHDTKDRVMFYKMVESHHALIEKLKQEGVG